MPKNREQRRRETRKNQREAVALSPRCLARSVARKHGLRGKGWQSECATMLKVFEKRRLAIQARKLHRVLPGLDCTGAFGGAINK